MREWLPYFFFKRRLRKKLHSLYEAEDPWSSRELSVFFAPLIREQMEELPAEIRSSPVLDAGGGEGHYYVPLRDLISDYHLLDIESRALARARELLSDSRYTLIHKSLDCYQPPADTYSAIWLFNVLTYVGAKQYPLAFGKITANLWRSLRSGGKVLLLHPYYSAHELQGIQDFGRGFASFGGSVILNVCKELGKQTFWIQAVEKL